VKFESSAVFGIPTKDDTLPGFDVPTDLSLPEDLTPPLRATDPVKPTEACPAAKLTAFPKLATSVSVTGMPPEGVYKWQRDLFTIKDARTEPAKFISSQFALQSRAIRRVTKESDHQFSFDMLNVDPFEPSHTVITTFNVNTNPELFVDRRVDARTIGVVNIPGTDVRVANPSDAPGIFISRIEWQDDKGTRVSLFDPVQPMLIAPLEGGILRTGQSFRSVGINKTDGNVLANDGTIGRPSRIDACGEIVEGYVVNLHQTLTTDVDQSDPVDAAARYATTNETREVTYTFATQYGTLPIAETLSIGDVAVDPVAVLGKWELGGLTPGPLPASLK
jgi:hypothetical protein